MKENKDSSEVVTTNQQIKALNAQIDAINLHLSQHNINIHLCHLQADVVQSQIVMIKQQLLEIEAKIKVIYVKINNIETNIFQDIDLSFNDNIQRINKSIEDINKRIKIINPQIEIQQNSSMGFDIVIGNPPYVSANNMSIKDREELNNSLEYLTLTGKWDLYIAFIEKALRLVSNCGIFTFIIPYGFLNQPFAKAIRQKILEKFTILSIVDLHNEKIFQNATVPSCIPLIQNQIKEDYSLDILEFYEDDFQVKHSIDIQKYHNSEQYMFRTENLNKFSNILEKIKKDNSKIKSYFYVSTGAEIHGKEKRSKDGSTVSGKSKFEVLYHNYSDNLKPYIEGSAIIKSKKGRYSYPKIDTWLDYSNPEKMRSSKFKELFDSEKIIIRGSSGLLRILAIYDEEKIYTSHKCILVINKCNLPQEHKEYLSQKHLELKYLLAILNSQLIDFYYASVYGGFIDVYPNNLKELPIKVISFEKQQTLIKLVDKILKKKKIDIKADVSEIEQQIDNLVYKLYELTYEEVKIIDPEFTLTEKEYEAITLE
jgi:hypothetical protein